ncbi:MAG: hypothetical protein AAFQ63_09030 [Cyanobacteria bacterium J06621_11]
MSVSDAQLSEDQFRYRSILEHQLHLGPDLSADVAEILVRRPTTRSPTDHALILKALQNIVQAHIY